ncbi:MAG: hypothetical protein AAFX40_11860, partial [Cyanobacteria bacterium J06639_1]
MALTLAASGLPGESLTAENLAERANRLLPGANFVASELDPLPNADNADFSSKAIAQGQPDLLDVAVLYATTVLPSTQRQDVEAIASSANFFIPTGNLSGTDIARIPGTTPIPTASPSPGVTPIPSASPSPTPSASPSPTPSASPSPTATPTPTPSATPTPLPPAMNQIAFVVTDGSGTPVSIDTVMPDGTGRSTLWQAPDTITQLRSLDWKPDGTELAFDSDHEAVFTALSSDVFAISADGSQLRRVTNAPSFESIQGGSFETGSVRVTLTNNYQNVVFDPVGTFIVYIEGAERAFPITLPPLGESTTFDIPNVADLGEQRAQFAVISYSSGVCGTSKQRNPGAILDIQPDEAIEANLVFVADGCGAADAVLDTSWQFNGTDIGFILGADPLRIPAAGGTTGDVSAWFSAFTNETDWSPVNDDVLFAATTRGIGLLREGASEDEVVLPDSEAVNPAWFPDGNRFVYKFGSELGVADLANSTANLVTNLGAQNLFAENPSVSPDGNFIAFTVSDFQRTNIAVLNLQTNQIELLTA